MRFLFGDYTLDVDRRELRCRDALVAVEPQVFDLLLHVIRNRDRVVSRDDLLEAVWNGRIVSDSTVGQRINAARRAIGDSGEQQKFIRTLARRGVRFVGEVRCRPARRRGVRPIGNAAGRCDPRPAGDVLPIVGRREPRRRDRRRRIAGGEDRHLADPSRV